MDAKIKRTPIQIDKTIHQRTKIYAATNQTTFKTLVETLLEGLLNDNTEGSQYAEPTTNQTTT